MDRIIKEEEQPPAGDAPGTREQTGCRGGEAGRQDAGEERQTGYR
jgi:hypothetical protein